MTNVLFVGDSSTGLEIEIKGSDAEFFVRPHRLQTWLIKAMEEHDQITVTHIPTEQALSHFPFTLEELKQYQVIMFSDVDSDSFQLYPSFMGDDRIPLGPNRLKLLEQFVLDGGAFIMGGGYASYSGRRGIGNFGRTPVEKMLPVSMLSGDDRAEWPEGFHSKAVEPNHPIFEGLNWDTEDFLFLGYNATKLKQGAQLLAEHEGDPIVAVWQYGKGRTMAFTPDPQPHWSGNFHRWSGYPRFWSQAVDWLTQQKPTE